MARPQLSLLLFGLVCAASMLATAGCGGSPPPPSSKQPSGAIARPSAVHPPHTHGRNALNTTAPVAAHSKRGSDEVLKPSGLHAHPDPAIRLYALKAWALNPGPSLDPVTHALVDPDETVRARAQEVFEEALARR